MDSSSSVPPSIPSSSSSSSSLSVETPSKSLRYDSHKDPVPRFDIKIVKKFMKMDPKETQIATIPAQGSDPEIKMAYQKIGSDTAPHRLVFISGMCASLSDHDAQYEYFASLDTFQTLYIDNRGTGSTPSSSTRYTTSLFARDIVRLLDYLGWDEAHFFGNSMGGMILQELFIVAPEKLIKSAIFSNTYTGNWIGSNISFIPVSTYPIYVRSFLKATPTDQVWNLLDTHFTQDFLIQDSEHEEFPSKRAEMMCRKLAQFQTTRPTPKPTAINHFLATQTHYLSSTKIEQIKNHPARKIVISSLGDVLIKPSEPKRLATRIKVPLVQLPDNGHCPHVQTPGIINRIIHNHVLGERINHPKHPKIVVDTKHIDIETIDTNIQKQKGKLETTTTEPKPKLETDDMGPTSTFEEDTEI